MRGESGSVTRGIVNNGHEPTTYRVEIAIDGEKVGSLGPITLAHEEEWKETVSLSPIRTGPNQKVEFWLYKDEGEEVYLKTQLWVDVIAESGGP